MKVGSIHKNSKTRYFAVGGYFSYEEDTIKIKAKYKKENLKLKLVKYLTYVKYAATQAFLLFIKSNECKHCLHFVCKKLVQ